MRTRRTTPTGQTLRLAFNDTLNTFALDADDRYEAVCSRLAELEDELAHLRTLKAQIEAAVAA